MRESERENLIRATLPYTLSFTLIARKKGRSLKFCYKKTSMTSPLAANPYRDDVSLGVLIFDANRLLPLH